MPISDQNTLLRTFYKVGESKVQIEINMLYTCSTSAVNKTAEKMKQYYVVHGHGNDEVVADRHDFNLFRKGLITAKGFALNYEMKLRSHEAHEWMARVSAEASHQDVVLIGEEEGLEKSCRTMLAEMMASMFGGNMNFRYAGDLK